MIEDLPKVSAIIPCYNGENFISGAIDSILSQTIQEFELIIVDDGSTDGSKYIVEKYLSDPRVKYFAHPNNRGIAAARNTGIKLSRSSFIAFLDQDDFWRPEKLKIQLEVFAGDRKGEIGVVFSNVEVVEDKGGRLYRRIIKPSAVINTASRLELQKLLVLKNFIPLISLVVRRECFNNIGLFDENILSGADDYDLSFRLVEKYRIAHIDEPLVIHTLHEKNYSSLERFLPDTTMILEREAQKNPELISAKDIRLHRIHINLGNQYLLNGKREKAKESYKRSLEYRRRSIKGFFAFLLSNFGGLGVRTLKGWRFLRKLLLGITTLRLL